MWFLLGTTLTASFFDSLNPSAIAQQMLLQAMVKKKRHIWFRNAAITAARTRSRKHKREISLEYLHR